MSSLLDFVAGPSQFPREAIVRLLERGTLLLQLHLLLPKLGEFTLHLPACLSCFGKPSLRALATVHLSKQTIAVLVYPLQLRLLLLQLCSELSAKILSLERPLQQICVGNLSIFKMSLSPLALGMCLHEIGRIPRRGSNCLVASLSRF